MSQIKSSDTKPELLVRSYLHRLGFRFRKNDKRLTGKPDLYFPRYYAVVFVNGCFWHGHRSCKKMRIPKSNTEYWTQKIERNKERDKEEVKSLLEQGYRVGVVWECSKKFKPSPKAWRFGWKRALTKITKSFKKRLTDLLPRRKC